MSKQTQNGHSKKRPAKSVPQPFEDLLEEAGRDPVPSPAPIHASEPIQTQPQVVEVDRIQVEPSDAQVVTAANQVVNERLFELGSLRDEFLRQETQRVANLQQARVDLDNTLKVMTAKYGINLDQGKWRYDFNATTFYKVP